MRQGRLSMDGPLKLDRWKKRNRVPNEPEQLWEPAMKGRALSRRGIRIIAPKAWRRPSYRRVCNDDELARVRAYEDHSSADGRGPRLSGEVMHPTDSILWRSRTGIKRVSPPILLGRYRKSTATRKHHARSDSPVGVSIAFECYRLHLPDNASGILVQPQHAQHMVRVWFWRSTRAVTSGHVDVRRSACDRTPNTTANREWIVQVSRA